jgi:hypothetical protein
MNKAVIGAAILSLPLIVGGLAIANASKPAKDSTAQAAAQGYVCPETGEVLPCPFCCPLYETSQK